ncbi:MAG: NFACT RNA binding domain-containing protein [Nanoarchaeota archaeon]
MEIEFHLNKSVNENAGKYFELAKKAKKKLQGAKAALEESRRKLEKLRKEEAEFLNEEKNRQEQKAKKVKKREWYEKFHWFISSEGFLCIGGKDATSNELVVKKHLEKDDLVLHTDMAGSPFFIIKNGQRAGEDTIKEAAQAVAVYSKAWKMGYTTADVFYVNPEQLSKEAKPGEYIAKGAFMIYGKTKYIYPKMEYALGLVEREGIEGGIIGGPVSAVEKKTSNYALVIPGKEKKSSLAKKIRARLKGGDLDEIIKFLPAGGGEIKK